MHDVTNKWIWFGFFIFIIIALSADTFFISKKQAHANKPIRAALAWTMFWIVCALVFNALFWMYLHLTSTAAHANKKALDFFTGYVIEKTLSFDNLFAFYLVFNQFKIPLVYQHRIFSYGIWSAVVLRLLLILLGSWLVMKFHWVLYLMGAFLLATGIETFFSSHKTKNLKDSFIFKWVKRFFRITHEIKDERFFVRKNHLLYATPLFIALIFIELSDLIFAFDSIPAIFAITTDPFIVWSSNIFAILGLRALYFVLSSMIDRFYLLQYGIALILIFIGTKMLIAPWIYISSVWSLIAVFLILIFFTLLSIFLQVGPKHARH